MPSPRPSLGGTPSLRCWCVLTWICNRLTKTYPKDKSKDGVVAPKKKGTGKKAKKVKEPEAAAPAASS